MSQCSYFVQSKMATSNCFPYRPHDYMYDPIFTVSGPSDHYKAAMVAKMSAAKFQICPIFPNMFSDLPSRPRVQLVPRKTAPAAQYREPPRSIDAALRRPPPDVLGADRLKYFCPLLNFPPKEWLPPQQYVTFTIEKVEKKELKKKVDYKTRNVSTETKFRESAAQTEPWEPPYKIVGKGDPEILKLDFLKWGSGLPAGMHEVRLIERARMKAAWEKSVRPDIKNENSLVEFRDYLEALERDEWAFRESEIAEIQELRLQLLEEMLNEVHENSKTRTEMKMRNFIEKKEAEKREQINRIRQKTARELRKLEAQRKGYSTRYKEPNIVDEHADKKSEIYGPLRRNGEHPKRWHQVVDEKMRIYRAQFIGVENFSTLPTWLDRATKIDKRRLYHDDTPGRRLCIRETKWTAPVLKELHEELKDLRKETQERPLSLRTKKEVPIEEATTPEVEGVPQMEEDKYQAAVLLQKVIRGRAAQMMIYEGRNTCKELIHELKYSVGLLKKQKMLKSKQKQKVKVQQREECKQLTMVHRLQGSLGKLQGSVVGTLLDFLNKELRRLLEERKAHAMCLVNERERYIREAAEAGRRQKELRRRREHDEMFKQVVKVTQESVDVYLQNIITEGIEFASSEEAKEYIDKLAKKIEFETERDYKQSATASVTDQDEMIADMVLHFMLPDVEKQLIREKITTKQKLNLKTIHDSIYSDFEDLPKSGRHLKMISENTMKAAAPEVLQEKEDNVLTSSEWNSMEIPDDREENVHPIDFLDPYEEYLRQLMAEEPYNEHHFPHVEAQISDDSSEFQLRNDVLETITEVDTESSSNKDM